MSFRAVASSLPSTNDAGFATPAALLLSLALALVGTAMIGRSVGLLKLTKADLDRTETDYALAGAQLEAAATVVRAGVPGPFHWTSSTDQGWVDIRAEREADKLSLATASTLAPAVLASFGATDPVAIQAKLAAAATADVADVSTMDRSSLWQACAARLMSSFGQSAGYTFVPDVQPAIGDKPPQWHVGETWRIRVTTSTGWRDDRLVRFTGNSNEPAATILRTVSKGDGEGGRCESLLQAVGAA